MLAFVDANIFIRLFAAEDDHTQAARSEELLKRARAGEIDLITGPPVLFEIAWTLSYRYKLADEKVLDVLEAILAFPNLKVTDRELVVKAICLAKERGGGYADSYIAVSASYVKADNVATFNVKDFTKLGASLLNF